MSVTKAILSNELNLMELGLWNLLYVPNVSSVVPDVLPIITLVLIADAARPGSTILIFRFD